MEGVLGSFVIRNVQSDVVKVSTSVADGRISSCSRRRRSELAMRQHGVGKPHLACTWLFAGHGMVTFRRRSSENEMVVTEQEISNDSFASCDRRDPVYLLQKSTISW